MSQINIKQHLIMKEAKGQTKKSEYSLDYEAVQTQGQCTLKQITPSKLNKIRYYIFCVISILLIGIPVVFAYWYPKFKLFLYYNSCNYQQCTHFVILNYDNQITIVERKIQQETVPTQQNNNFLEQYANYGYKINKQSSYFINRYMKYKIIPTQNSALVRADIFQSAQGLKDFLNSYWVKQVPVKGQQQQKVKQLRKRFGPGTMIIQRPGLAVLFFRQIVRPLYFFIVATLIIWLNENYVYYCIVIFLTTVVGIAINLYQTYTLNNKIYEMAYYETDVNALRGDKVVKISSMDIVPGDIVFLKDPIKIPFDAILLQGSALLNQCALTGQSVPIVRKAQDLRQLLKMVNSNDPHRLMFKNNLVCEGTTIIQVDSKKKMQIFEQFRQQYGVPTYIIRTNFVTLKGQLIRIISFPMEKTNIFEKQSSRFLIFLFCLAVISYSIMLIKLLGLVRTKDLILKFLDLVTITVPPGLPVSMTFGIIYAIDKLKKKQIYCVSPSKVIMGGLVDMICFDKTGTLTQDFMDFRSLVPANQGQFRESIHNHREGLEKKNNYDIQKLLKASPYLQHILTNMASNHTIISVASTGQNVGDPMQIKLFQFGGYRFTDEVSSNFNVSQVQQIVFGFENKGKHQGVVVRRMDFDSQLLRMSVVAKSNIKENSQSYYIYTKGSPQAIAKILKPQSFPKNYYEILKYYASLGLRVLAIGHRKLQNEEVKMDRLALQSNLQFDGFEIFQNRLKPETKAAIFELKNAKIPCVMITGDNALTGSNIAYKCKVADLNKKLYIFNYNPIDNKLQFQQFHYEPDQQDLRDQDIFGASIQDNLNSEQKQIQLAVITKNNNSKQGIHKKLINDTNSSSDQVIDKLLTMIDHYKAQICLTGTAFNYLFENCKLDEMDNKRKQILKHTKVFARAKPNDKARIVMAYQQGLNKIVSMCGDGANDCGALKQSDAGLSLAQTQASISAPFTSKITNVSSMVELIKQCRAGLVTNFSLFNIMALYSLIQYSSAIICQFFFSYPADFSFLYWDICGNFLFFMTFGYTGTAQKLSQHKPPRSLFTVTNLLQVGSMYLLQLVGQILMIFSISNFFSQEVRYWENGGSQNNYKYYKDNGNSFTTSSPQTNVIFLFSNFMYIFSFLAFSVSKPWRKQFYTNVPFMIIFFFTFTYSVLLVVVPKSRLPVFEILYMNSSLVNLYVLLVSLIFGMLIYFNQKCILEPIATKLRQKFPTYNWI